MAFEVRRRLREFLEPLLLPRYAAYAPQKMELARVQRWVFVCHGNLCRSPFGEWWARKRGILSASCGLEGIEGKPADPSAVRCALTHGVDMQAHAGKRLSGFGVHEHDLIIVFDPAHLEACAASAREACAQVMLLGLALPSPRVRIRDPYGAPDAVFDAVFRDTGQALAALERNWRAARQIG